jgi:hypothetical protein
MRTTVGAWLFAIALVIAVGLVITGLPGAMPRDEARNEMLGTVPDPATLPPLPTASPTREPIASSRPPASSRPTIPPCEEDEVVWGAGDFHADGYWDRYACIAVDELVKDATR